MRKIFIISVLTAAIGVLVTLTGLVTTHRKTGSGAKSNQQLRLNEEFVAISIMGLENQIQTSLFELEKEVSRFRLKKSKLEYQLSSASIDSMSIMAGITGDPLASLRPDEINLLSKPNFIENEFAIREATDQLQNTVKRCQSELARIKKQHQLKFLPFIKRSSTDDAVSWAEASLIKIVDKAFEAIDHYSK